MRREALGGPAPDRVAEGLPRMWARSFREVRFSVSNSSLTCVSHGHTASERALSQPQLK